ncbi:WD40 repeat domain-containing protein [Zavarzinella formosa]|uniref:WD40 repeat domain-containing protein n=1 Tax=Zavarzinella formosa TaxID=360055 RepID=UPI0002D59483|nr:WD40 repeat domain-containing protein [Zavarzinella formosa]
MRLRRLFAGGVGAALVLLLCWNEPTVGQVTPKGKVAPKKGLVISPDTIDLTKTGAISDFTLVQHPPALKGVRSWTWETKIHRWYPLSMAISADGKKLATGGYDTSIHIWDVDTGKHLMALLGHNSYVGGLDFSLDGAYLASAGMWDGTARVWDMKTGQPIKIFREHKGYTGNVAWAPDGKRLAVTSDSSGELVIWDIATSKPFKKTEYGNPITQVVWSKNGEKLGVSASKGGTYIADASTLKTIHSLKDMTAVGTSVGFSADDKLLIVGTNSGMIEYETEEGKIRRNIAVPGYFAEYLPDGRIAASTAGGATGFVVPTATTAEKTLPTVASQMKVSRDGKTLVTMTAGTVTLWEIDNQPKQRNIRVGDLLRPIWQANQPMILGVTTSKSPTLWDTNSGKLLCTLDGHADTVTVAAFPGTGKFVATGGADKTVRVWESATGKNLRMLEGHRGAITALSITSDGKVASGAADNKAMIWPAKSDMPVTLGEHTKTVTAVAWSKDGSTLATGSADNTVILWTAAGKKIRVIPEHPAEVRSLAWSPAGDRLAVGAVDDRIRIYQASTGKLIALQESLGSPPEVTALAFSPDGNTILSGRSNHTLQLWSGKTAMMTPIQSVTVGAPVHSAAYSTDGKTFATGSLDRCVRFWDANAKVKAVAVAETEQLIFISADGHYRTTSDAEELLVAVVLTENSMQTLTPKEFAAKFGLKNIPANVKAGQ